MKTSSAAADGGGAAPWPGSTGAPAFSTAGGGPPYTVGANGLNASVDQNAPLMATAQAPGVEAGSGYTWSDTHFNETEGIIAVFDFDYDVVIDFDYSVTQCCWALCPVPTLIIPSLCCVPCFAKSNIEWKTRAMHVAVHQDGIKFVNDKRKNCCGLTFTDKGKNSKTVPFDKLTDCDVQEPAGTAVCCFVPNVLSNVIVDTASSGAPDPNTGIARHELDLRGLKDPHGFKKCVWDCKRSAVNLRGGNEGVVGAGGMDMNRSGGGAEQTALLSEIRDELKMQTKLLQETAAAGSSSS